MGRDRRNGMRKPDFRRLWGIAGFRQMARPANLSARVFSPLASSLSARPWHQGAAGVKAGSFAHMRLTIRNMVCARCVAAVQRILDASGLPATHIDLGEVELEHEPTAAQLTALGEALQREGFELVSSRDAATIARIKAAIVKLVHHNDEAAPKVKLSEHLSDALHKDYSGLSALFTQVEGITIEQFFLLQRLERVKELIRYDELTLSEIAFRAGFSSVAHLSAQFKKLTGMTPSAFKGMGRGRVGLDEV